MKFSHLKTQIPSKFLCTLFPSVPPRNTHIDPNLARSINREESFICWRIISRFRHYSNEIANLTTQMACQRRISAFISSSWALIIKARQALIIIAFWRAQAFRYLKASGRCYQRPEESTLIAARASYLKDDCIGGDWKGIIEFYYGISGEREFCGWLIPVFFFESLNVIASAAVGQFQSFIWVFWYRCTNLEKKLG